MILCIIPLYTPTVVQLYHFKADHICPAENCNGKYFWRSWAGAGIPLHPQYPLKYLYSSSWVPVFAKEARSRREFSLHRCNWNGQFGSYQWSSERKLQSDSVCRASHMVPDVHCLVAYFPNLILHCFILHANLSAKVGYPLSVDCSMLWEAEILAFLFPELLLQSRVY